MKKFITAWATTWRMVAYGTGLGVASGAIYGPISMLILYTADLLNGRYNLSNFPIGSAITYCLLAFVVGLGFGGILGFFAGIISGVILAIGLLFMTGHLFGSKLYRNGIVVLSVIASSVIILVPLSQAVLGDGWFFNGQGVIPPLLALAVLPTILSAISVWWACSRVIKWWEKAGYGGTSILNEA